MRQLVFIKMPVRSLKISPIIDSEETESYNFYWDLRCVRFDVDINLHS